MNPQGMQGEKTISGALCKYSVNMQKNLYIPLNIQAACGILGSVKRRRSILVRSAVSEEGPKNPFKGIAVKPLVPASYAQFGVGAGWKARRTPRLRP